MFKEISFGDEPSVTPNHDIIFKNGFAIATHDDADFWIADETTWFASGKTKKSPVAAAIAAANDANAKPALLLLATNIQDLADKIQEWESMGIKIIKDINEIKI